MWKFGGDWKWWPHNLCMHMMMGQNFQIHHSECSYRMFCLLIILCFSKFGSHFTSYHLVLVWSYLVVMFLSQFFNIRLCGDYTLLRFLLLTDSLKLKCIHSYLKRVISANNILVTKRMTRSIINYVPRPLTAGQLYKR